MKIEKEEFWLFSTSSKEPLGSAKKYNGEVRSLLRRG
jgi:hypothetical protein